MINTIQVKHGKPNSPFFIIIHPKRDWNFIRFSDTDFTIVELIDPRDSTKVIKAELHTFWDINEQSFFNLAGLCKLAYERTPEDLYPILLNKYPELKNKFELEYWLLKRI